jgi:branched-chain amino acid transport system permease protein
MLTGVGGITSFGQAAFVGLGAYATAWICTSPTATHALSALPAGALPWLGLLLGLAVTALIAWFLGAVTLQAGGPLPAAGHHGLGPEPVLPVRQPRGPGRLHRHHRRAAAVHRRLRAELAARAGRADLAVLLLAIWGLHNLLDSREGRAIRALKGGG